MHRPAQFYINGKLAGQMIQDAEEEQTAFAKAAMARQSPATGGENAQVSRLNLALSTKPATVLR